MFAMLVRGSRCSQCCTLCSLRGPNPSRVSTHKDYTNKDYTNKDSGAEKKYLDEPLLESLLDVAGLREKPRLSTFARGKLSPGGSFRVGATFARAAATSCSHRRIPMYLISENDF